MVFLPRAQNLGLLMGHVRQTQPGDGQGHLASVAEVTEKQRETRMMARAEEPVATETKVGPGLDIGRQMNSASKGRCQERTVHAHSRRDQRKMFETGGEGGGTCTWELSVLFCKPPSNQNFIQNEQLA